MPQRDYWTFFADECRRSEAPLYVRLTEGIGADDELRALAQTARPGQPPANMLLGAVHFLLLQGAQHPLRTFYPNLNGGISITDDDPFPAFKDFIGQHREKIAAIVATRITNTNEVGRSGVLNAGFRALAAEAGEPLHLIEIGPSAGLNMVWDRYGVRYLGNGRHCAADAPGAELTIDIALRGTRAPPLGKVPRITRRVGLERNPVDLGDADARDWLRALVWPDHGKRLERLDRALAILASAKPEIREGDALDLLPDALAEAPVDETLCVYHTIVTYQFTYEMREALDHILVVAGLRRPVWRLALEWEGENRYPLRLICYRNGIRKERALALCDPHGTWIEWQA